MTARPALLMDASLTAVSALVLIAAREALSPLFGLTSPSLLNAIGGILLLYAGSLTIAARRDPPHTRALLTAALLNAAWVLGSAIVLIAAWSALTPAGRTLIIATALVVEVFAVLQFRASRAHGDDRH